MKRIAAALLTAAFAVASAAVPASSAEPVSEAVQNRPDSDMDPLIGRADLIVLGSVERLEQKLNETRIRLSVERVFKGDPAVSHIEVRHRGGKHTVDLTEPSFKPYDKAVLYLQKDDGFYRCVDGAQGKKTIVNDNVYVQPDNAFVSTTVKKYVQLLETRLKKTPAQG